jgi:hypothetical protein
MTAQLSSYLFRVYGGYADKRLKNVAFGRAIRIAPASESINQNIHCVVLVDVQPDDEIVLRMFGNVPYDEAVSKSVLRLDPDATNTARQISCRFTLTPAKLLDLANLARAVDQVTAPGKRYPHPSWKHSSVETAYGLRELATRLDEYLTRKDHNH